MIGLNTNTRHEHVHGRGRGRDETREGKGDRLKYLVSVNMRIEMPFTILTLIASVAHFSGAARSADHHIWAKQPREITSNSLLDLEDNEEPIIGGGGGGAKNSPSDFKTDLRQRVSELPDLRNIRRYGTLKPEGYDPNNVVLCTYIRT